MIGNTVREITNGLAMWLRPVSESKRTERRVQRVEVRHVAQPMGGNRESGPHLIDLREFVAACAGLPGDLLVHVDQGRMDEGGRRVVTFSVSQETMLP